MLESRLLCCNLTTKDEESVVSRVHRCKHHRALPQQQTLASCCHTHNPGGATRCLPNSATGTCASVLLVDRCAFLRLYGSTAAEPKRTSASVSSILLYKMSNTLSLKYFFEPRQPLMLRTPSSSSFASSFARGMGWYATD